MTDEYKEYLFILVRSIPGYLYEGIASMLVVGVVLILSIKGLKKGWRNITGWILIEYLFLIFCSTVFFRHDNEIRTHRFSPFWSYVNCYKGDGFHLDPEIGLNILVFMPVGLLFGLSFKSFNWMKVMLMGATISVSIEFVQFIFKRGLCEFDDVFNNTVGGIIGYGLYWLTDKTISMIFTKK